MLYSPELRLHAPTQTMPSQDRARTRIKNRDISKIRPFHERCKLGVRFERYPLRSPSVSVQDFVADGHGTIKIPAIRPMALRRAACSHARAARFSLGFYDCQEPGTKRGIDSEKSDPARSQVSACTGFDEVTGTGNHLCDAAEDKSREMSRARRDRRRRTCISPALNARKRV